MEWNMGHSFIQASPNACIPALNIVLSVSEPLSAELVKEQIRMK